MPARLESASPWPDLPAEYLGGVDPELAGDSTTNELLIGMAELDRGAAFLAYAEYRSAAALFDQLVAGTRDTDHRVVDAFADCAARIARARGLTQYAAEQVLDHAVALRGRLPKVLACLRDGVIVRWQAQAAITRTDLLDADSPAASLIDAEISALIRDTSGSWSRKRFRDMVDRIIFRHDPDAVRDRRQDALDARGVWTESRPDGVGEIVGVMSAENIRIAAAAVAALADATCRDDRRTRQQRRSDAMFALLSGTPFTCDCGRSECSAEIPEPGTVPPVDPKIIIHVVCDEGTLDGTAANAGLVDGHGVISDAHVRDLAARTDAVIRPIVPDSVLQEPDGTYTLPSHLPSDPYRPSAALDTFIRVRDGECVDPGCECSAFDADLDHVHEFDHGDPCAGGQTTADGMNAKCRFGHRLKTFGEWIDDQYRDVSGRLRTEYTTPEGLLLPGEAENNEVMFPGLRRIRFATPAGREWAPAPDDEQAPSRVCTRVAEKHARRRAERARNRLRRLADPPPF